MTYELIGTRLIVAQNPVDLDHLIGVAVCPICPIEPEPERGGLTGELGAGTNSWWRWRWWKRVSCELTLTGGHQVS
jgi:hypothetical protein